MKKQILKWGILGTARIARKELIPAIKESKLGDVQAVASRSLTKAQEFAQANLIPTAYGSYAELLQDPEVNAVYIPLPNDQHAPWAIEAMTAGKHVLVEKPAALDTMQATEMQRVAEENHVILMEAFMYRFHPRFEKIIETIRDGSIGNLRFIHSVFSYNITNPDDIRLIPEMGGGALFDVGTYCINISRQLTGREPIAVHAQYYEGNTGIDLQMASTMDFGDNIYAQFECAFNTFERQRCHIAGSKGTLDLIDPFKTSGNRTEATMNNSEGIRTFRFGAENEYRHMVDHFSRCVMGKEKPRFAFSDAIANMLVLDKLMESARSGGTVIRLA